MMQHLELHNSVSSALGTFNERFKNDARTVCWATGGSLRERIEFVRASSALLDDCLVVASSRDLAMLLGCTTLRRVLGLSDESDSSKTVPARPARLLTSIKSLILVEIQGALGSELDALDRHLRTVRRRVKPFGGVQTFIVGDLYDQPGPDCFSAEKASFWNDARFMGYRVPAVVSDSKRSLLQMLRTGRSQDLETEFASRIGSGKNGVVLHPSIGTANSENSKALDRLSSVGISVDPVRTPGFLPGAILNGSSKSKVGCYAVSLNSEYSNFLPGSLAQVIELTDQKMRLMLNTDRIIDLPRISFETFIYVRARGGSLERESIGNSSQFPVIFGRHISLEQSITLRFSEVTMDLSSWEANRYSIYAMLSRVDSPESLKLSRPLTLGELSNNPEIDKLDQLLETSF